MAGAAERTRLEKIASWLVTLADKAEHYAAQDYEYTMTLTPNGARQFAADLSAFVALAEACRAAEGELHWVVGGWAAKDRYIVNAILTALQPLLQPASAPRSVTD